MRIFLAGASGVIGVRLIPLLARDGPTMTGLMTKFPGQAVLEQRLGELAVAVYHQVFTASPA